MILACDLLPNAKIDSYSLIYLFNHLIHYMPIGIAPLQPLFKTNTMIRIFILPIGPFSCWGRSRSHRHSPGHSHSLVPVAVHGTYGSPGPENTGEPCMTPYGVVIILGVGFPKGLGLHCFIKYQRLCMYLLIIKETID